MLQVLRNSLAAMLEPGDRVLVALSGGRDSVALLHGMLACRSFGYSLFAGHVHHGIRGEADREADFVRRLCAEWGVPCAVRRVDAPALAAARGLSLEDAARRLRYAALEEMAVELGANRIALAHHRRDQAETVLLHLVRGAGTRGLGGMAPVRPPFLRPLLDVSWEAIEAYAAAHELPYCLDGSNADQRYARNRLRLSVLPALRALNPGLDETLARTACLAREEEEWLSALADQTLAGLGSRQGGRWRLDAARLTALPLPLQRRVLRRAVEELGALRDFSSRRLELALELAHQGRTGATLDLGQGLTAWREYGFLCLGRPVQAAENWAYPLVPGRLALPGGVLWVGLSPPDPVPAAQLRLLPAALLEGAVARNRRPGDWLRLPRCGTRKLKDVFIDRKIPRGERDRWPLVAQGSRVLWAIGLCGEPWPGETETIALAWVPETDQPLQ